MWVAAFLTSGRDVNCPREIGGGDDDFTETPVGCDGDERGRRSADLSIRAGAGRVGQVEPADPPVREHGGRVTIAPGTSATREFG
jgi:hypothetical protein